jgi:hypothetical protein
MQSTITQHAQRVPSKHRAAHTEQAGAQCSSSTARPAAHEQHKVEPPPETRQTVTPKKGGCKVLLTATGHLSVDDAKTLAAAAADISMPR